MKKIIRGLINHKAIPICFALLLVLNYGVRAQNASYNQNSIPIAGTNNTALGAFVLPSVTSGFDNVAIGRNALFFNTTGFENSALGRNALYDNTTGAYIQE